MEMRVASSGQVIAITTTDWLSFWQVAGQLDWPRPDSWIFDYWRNYWGVR